VSKNTWACYKNPSRTKFYFKTLSIAFRPLSARRPSASTRRLPAAAGSNVLEIYFCLSILAGQFVQVLNFCKQGNSLVGQFVHVLHFFVARLKQSEMKTSQLTGREKETEKVNKSIVRLVSLFTCLI
jgi:hypothetical protein